MRIDHILIGGLGQASQCWVGPDVGSPHRPVIAVAIWPAAAVAGARQRHTVVFVVVEWDEPAKK